MAFKLETSEILRPKLTKFDFRIKKQCFLVSGYFCGPTNSKTSLYQDQEKTLIFNAKTKTLWFKTMTVTEAVTNRMGHDT